MFSMLDPFAADDNPTDCVSREPLIAAVLAATDRKSVV